MGKNLHKTEKCKKNWQSKVKITTRVDQGFRQNVVKSSEINKYVLPVFESLIPLSVCDENLLVIQSFPRKISTWCYGARYYLNLLKFLLNC